MSQVKQFDQSTASDQTVAERNPTAAQWNLRPVWWLLCERPTPTGQLDELARHYEEAGSNRVDLHPSI